MVTPSSNASLTRRDALKGAALVSMATAASTCGVIAQASEATTEDETWDKEVEVIVAGTGTAVHAAIACAEFGATSVLVVEKSDSIFGGTSGVSGGGYALAMLDYGESEGISDTRDSVLEYMRGVGDGRMDENVQASFVDTCNEFAHFVVDTFDWDRWGHINQAFGDYYELYEASLPNAFGHGSWYPFDKEGNQLSAPKQWPAYQEYLESHDNVELVMGVSVNDLVTDDAGVVIGVILSDGTRVKARAVILGTGGFEYSEKMRKLYLPFPYMRSNGMVTNTGDGQRMGAKIGGELAYMDTTFGCPYFVTTPDFDPTVFESNQLGSDAFAPRGLPHSVIVNHKGRRFCDESTMYDTMNRAFGTYDTGTMEYVNIPGYWIADAQYASLYLMPGYSTTDNLPDYVFAFDTLEELADSMGIDKEALLQEMAAFNENAAQGKDPVWHRGEKVVSANTLAMMGAMLQLDPAAEPQTSVLGTVEQGPFYCVRYVPGMMGGTRGGLHINENAQVLNVDGEEIPGLYATGNCSSGVAGYWAGGATLGQGAVMGYIAAKHIMGK
ncbi:MAG: FAD-binding protein [Coriobacteriia bacterium]|nr:FAD-binding protein [Coriobacteriia bacterium]